MGARGRWHPPKNGVRLSMLFQTTVNPVRQDEQALIKQWWSEIGVETELKAVDGASFFGADPGNPDSRGRFFRPMPRCIPTPITCPTRPHS